MYFHFRCTGEMQQRTGEIEHTPFRVTGMQKTMPKIDDFVKSPSAALHCILTHCSVPVSTPHSFVFVCVSVHLNLFTLSSDL